MSWGKFVKRHFGKTWKVYGGILTVPYIFYRASKPVGDLFGGWIDRHWAIQNGVASIDSFGKSVLGYGGLAALVSSLSQSSALRGYITPQRRQQRQPKLRY